MFKRNYKFEKHKKDEAKKQKADQKRQKKLEQSQRNREADTDAPAEPGDTPAE